MKATTVVKAYLTRHGHGPEYWDDLVGDGRVDPQVRKARERFDALLEPLKKNYPGLALKLDSAALDLSTAQADLAFNLGQAVGGQLRQHHAK